MNKQLKRKSKRASYKVREVRVRYRKKVKAQLVTHTNPAWRVLINRRVQLPNSSSTPNKWRNRVNCPRKVPTIKNHHQVA